MTKSNKRIHVSGIFEEFNSFMSGFNIRFDQVSEGISWYCFSLRTMFLHILGLVALWFVYRWFKESKKVPNKEDKYVYITGCDSGFGNLLAKHLDKLGFRVIAGCYTEKGEDELKKISSDRLTTTHLDVTDSESVSKVAAFIGTLVGQKGTWIHITR